jgi:2-polyprenyl-3-methyl-5-hydroxy-6-metoxy-1,4-benzoquinol methylase
MACDIPKPTRDNKYMLSLKRFLYPFYCVVTGHGGGFLKHKQEVHRRRRIAELEVLEEAKTNPSLFRENSCPACGERQFPRDEFSNPIGYKFARCPADGTIYMDPIPTDATLTRMYNHPAESYLWLRDNKASSVKVMPTDIGDYRAILRLLPGPLAGLKLLDVGCAIGGFLMTAQETFDVFGCELNDSTAETARSHGFRVRTGSIADIPGQEEFDIITMLQVIEHLPTPADSLREAFRLLKPGGYFYCNTPNIDSLSFNLLKDRHIHVSSFGHVSLFNRESLILLGKRCGFEFLVHEHCGGRDFALHDWLSLRLANQKFKHRHAFYKTRFYFAAVVLERFMGGLFPKAFLPEGHDSYHRAIFRKPLAPVH